MEQVLDVGEDCRNSKCTLYTRDVIEAAKALEVVANDAFQFGLDFSDGHHMYLSHPKNGPYIIA